MLRGRAGISAMKNTYRSGNRDAPCGIPQYRTVYTAISESGRDVVENEAKVSDREIIACKEVCDARLCQIIFF